MLHTIENEKLICKIESVGAEVRSLVCKQTGKEYIWQINPNIWGSSSPVLFPAIGKIKDSKVTYQQQEYAMPKHGIIRNNHHLQLKSISSSKAEFSLSTSAETLKQYPFQFSFRVSFSLIGQSLHMHYNIENKDTQTMYFACGGHTAYACPINKSIQLNDYVVEFPKNINLRARTLGDSGLLSSKIRAIKTEANLLYLSNTLFNEDALIFENMEADWVRLRRKDAEKGVVVRFKNYPHLALWSKPKADYVCIEPWLGLPDAEDESTDLEHKSTYQKLQPNSSFSIAIETEIE